MLSAALALGVAGQARAGDWNDILREGSGRTVIFHAWGGDERTNAFIAWAGGRVRSLYRIELHQVKLHDTAEAVARLAAEKAAGKRLGGAGEDPLDLIWIGGSDLATLREKALLDGPVLNLLPGARRIDRVGKPATVTDRMEPLDGYAVPWRLAQVVFIHDSVTNPDPPLSIPALLDWAQSHPGRLTHLPAHTPLGMAFLEQALHELVADPQMLLRPVTPAGFARAAAPFWDWYDKLRPALWHGGKAFPASLAEQRALMQQGQIDLMISLNPAEAVTSIADGTLPASARAYVLERGTIGHCSFVGVPFNAAHRAGALVVADFLLSPEAQARDSDPRFVGSPTVLAMDLLSPADYVFFDAVPRAPNLLSDAERGMPLQEPHVSWVNQILSGWEGLAAG